VDCGRPANAPLVVVEQPAKESELALLVQDFNLHEVGKLAGECLHLLVQPRQFALDLVRSKTFMLLLVNCVLSSPIAPAGSRKSWANAAPMPLFDRGPSRTMA
jgi:hypothetical protein